MPCCSRRKYRWSVFLLLLSILVEIAHSAEAKSLASLPLESKTQPVNPADCDRSERVTNWLHNNYAQQVSITELAKLACLTPSALCRVFKRATQMTVGDYTTRLRIGKACALLIERRHAISYIAGAVGYSSLANFNRHFRAEKGMTPREFQKLFPNSR